MSQTNSTINDASIAAMEVRLGYSFIDKGMLNRALTHSSDIPPSRRNAQSYQRLEFLGDRVLGLIIADMLHAQFPNENEGELSRRLNALVRKETCADVARDLQVGPAIRMGDSERRSGGEKKEAILGDVCEAIIGAIYRDGNIEAARTFITTNWQPRLSAAQSPGRDAKTTLQEWAQSKGLTPPIYQTIDRSGPDHAPEFTIRIEIPGYAPVDCKGRSKKHAEHSTAETFLRRERIWDPS